MRKGKVMFKAGERVWHIRYGWGVLRESNINSKFPLNFTTDGVPYLATLTLHGFEMNTDINPVIFYKEQTFDISKPEPEIGTWGYFWDDCEKDLSFGKLVGKVEGLNRYVMYSFKGTVMYAHFSPDIPPHIKELMNGTNKPNP